MTDHVRRARRAVELLPAGEGPIAIMRPRGRPGQHELLSEGSRDRVCLEVRCDLAVHWHMNFPGGWWCDEHRPAAGLGYEPAISRMCEECGGGAAADGAGCWYCAGCLLDDEFEYCGAAWCDEHVGMAEKHLTENRHE